MTKSITVTSNDPHSPTSTIRVKAFVEVVFDFERPSLYLGKVNRDGSITKSAFLLVKNLEETEVLAITPSSEFITAKMLEFTDNDGHYDRMKLEITALPGLPLGRINETITVKTNLEEKPTAVLRLTGSVIGDVEVTPEWMTFVVTDTASSRPSTLTKKIFINNHVEGANLEIIDIRDPEGHLELSLRPLTEGKKYELTARLKTESIPERGNVSGNVILTTNFPSQKEVAIRYSAVRKSYGKKSGKTYSSSKKRPTGSPALRDGLNLPKGGENEGIFAASENDPFAKGGILDPAAKKELVEKKDTLSSQHDGGTKKLPEAGTDDETEKKEEEKKEDTWKTTG